MDKYLLSVVWMLQESQSKVGHLICVPGVPNKREEEADYMRIWREACSSVYLESSDDYWKQRQTIQKQGHTKWAVGSLLTLSSVFTFVFASLCTETHAGLALTLET